MIFLWWSICRCSSGCVLGCGLPGTAPIMVKRGLRRLVPGSDRDQPPTAPATSNSQPPKVPVPPPKPPKSKAGSAASSAKSDAKTPLVASSDQEKKPPPFRRKGTYRLLRSTETIDGKGGTDAEPLIILPTYGWKETWDAWILGLIVYSAVTAPFRISFDAEAVGMMYLFESSVTACFLIDVFLSFNTAYFENERWVMRRGPIAARCKEAEGSKALHAACARWQRPGVGLVGRTGRCGALAWLSHPWPHPPRSSRAHPHPGPAPMLHGARCATRAGRPTLADGARCPRPSQT